MGLCECGEHGGGRAPLAPLSVRGGCVGAGEGRPEGMERDTESLGPCGEVVRGILGDRFKEVLVAAAVVVVFVVGFWFLVGCCEGGRGWRMRTP